MVRENTIKYVLWYTLLDQWANYRTHGPPSNFSADATFSSVVNVAIHWTSQAEPQSLTPRSFPFVTPTPTPAAELPIGRICPLKRVKLARNSFFNSPSWLGLSLHLRASPYR
jgi:hypothetical protein